jgi:predicted Ser/Thr protein kinase
MQTRVLNHRYALETLLGQGGMATVYRGRDLRLGRLVALKLLHGYYADDDEFLQRFTHEAMSVATLSSHPNIVDVYDVGEDGDTHYIVMEYVEGNDLKTIIENEAPLTTERALHIAEQVAEGLEFAHSRGFIHRDVKPQNILISADGRVRIADFGIAKSMLSTAVTRTGIAFGTADYISPEQAQGLSATPQSDLYSLGIVLYEMLTGALPFTGPNPMAVALQHIQQEPPSPRQINPSIPAAIEAFILRAIAKDPNRRPSSAKAFAQELRDIRSGRAHQATVAAMPRQQRTAGPPAQTSRTEQRVDARRTAPARQRAQRRTYIAPPAYATAAPARRRRSSGSGFGTVLLAMLLLVGLVMLGYLVRGFDWQGWLDELGAGPAPVQTAVPTPTDTPVPTVLVPELIGLPEAQAVAVLNALGLQRRADPDDPTLYPEYSEAPRGTVIRQNPAPGVPVPQGAEITIVVSLGPEPGQ